MLTNRPFYMSICQQKISTQLCRNEVLFFSLVKLHLGVGFLWATHMAFVISLFAALNPLKLKQNLQNFKSFYTGWKNLIHKVTFFHQFFLQIMMMLKAKIENKTFQTSSKKVHFSSFSFGLDWTLYTKGVFWRSLLIFFIFTQK